MSEIVGLVGVGAMGQALLARMLLIDRKVQAYDVSDAAISAAREQGATIVTSPAAAAHNAQYVHVFVNTDKQVFDATLGDNGVIAGASERAIIFLHSTTLPETTRRVSAAAVKKGVRVLDAPITSVPRRVRDGASAYLVGGPEDEVSTARSYLESLGGKVYHFGPLGSGNIAKLAKNLANGAARVVLAESVKIVEAGGLDGRQFLEMMEAEEYASLTKQWKKIFSFDTGRAALRSATNIFNKDVHLAAEFARSLSLDAPLTQGTARTATKWVKAWSRGKMPTLQDDDI